eukprot:5601514-Pyramimonas_sp.AAC.1
MLPSVSWSLLSFRLEAKRDAGSDPRFRYWPDDYGVFLDWCSVHQRDARGARTRIGQTQVRRERNTQTQLIFDFPEHIGKYGKWGGRQKPRK